MRSKKTSIEVKDIDINLYDLKFIADAIRNSDDKDRVLESLWEGQLKSKNWLVGQLCHKFHISNAETVIFGGWCGILSLLLFNSDFGIKKITSVDIDPKCEEIATTINKRYEMQGKFKAVTADMCRYEYESDPYLVINTSCEHITQAQYTQWLYKVPKDSLVCIQSNNYFELPEHVNCMKDLGEFKRKSNLKIEFEATLELPKYNRFMLIGMKDV